jgi:hypothetical protein
MLPAFRHAPYWSAVALSLCLLIAAQLATTAHAQDAGAIQELTGILRPDEGIYFRVNGLQRGQTLYVHAVNTSGNLDPFLAVLAGETDVDLLRKQFAESVAALLVAGNGPIVAADLTAEALSLAWNDDLDVSHAAGLAFQAPADGDYLLLLRSSLVRPTFGGYRLLVGLDAPQVLTGNAAPTGDTVVVMDAERSTHTRGTQQVIGELTTPKVTTYYSLAPVDAGDTLVLRVEATSGDLRPIVELHDPTGKPVRIGNSAGQQTEALVEYTFPSTDSGYKLHISAGGAPEQPTSGAFRVLAAINEPIPPSDAIETGGRPILQLPIPVSLGVKLQQLTAVDQKAENYGAQVALRMEWQDPALAFDPDKCRCSEKTYSTESFKDFINAAKSRWPEFTLYNQQNNRWTQNRHVTVYPDGRAVYLERFTTTFQAPDFYFRRFPFDEQKFFIHVDGIYPEEAFIWVDNPQYTEVGAQLGEEEWYVTSSDTEVSTEAISTKRPTSRYSFRFVARRHLSYYIFRFFLPLGLILLVSWITFFLVDFTKRIEAASANLLLFIAWNFAIGGDLPHLNYLTFMDALIFSAFIISVTMVLYNVILRRMEIRDCRAGADRIDRVMIYAYPLSYLAAIAILYFFFF